MATIPTAVGLESGLPLWICVINYEQAQAKVNAKYNIWQKEVLVRFGSKLGAAMLKKRELEIEIFGSGENLTQAEVSISSRLADFTKKIARLQMKLVAEDKVVHSKITTLLSNWDKEKPISSKIQPDIAMNSINLFETQVNRIQKEYLKALDALRKPSNVWPLFPISNDSENDLGYEFEKE
ncbi:hypothetical protein BY996DRAFT_6418829 [Phakopsora pachyrhizi]|nr:hypothetical protein BY996DRAFT_6425843 [Phakopsora pachyrhizi]KAI8449134.1 hypothetical protein BY996DRAFT_6418829 [Phakopsora pachyrhizi]